MHHTTHPLEGVPGGVPFAPRRFSPLRACLLPAIIGAIIIGVVVISTGSALKGAFSAFSSFGSSSNSSSSSSSSSGGASNTDDQATITADIVQMKTAILPHLPTWIKQNDGKVHHVSYSDAGFKATDNTKEVVYGYCGVGKFYVYVLESSVPESVAADTEGYAYTISTSPDSCAPAGWNVVSSEHEDSDWYFVTLNTASATATAKAGQ